MNHISLGDKIAGAHAIGAGYSYSNACRRLLAEYRNMAAHNMLHPWTTTYGGSDTDLADRQLDLMVEAGLVTRPLFGDFSATDGLWAAGMKREPEKYNHDITVEANYELFQERRIAYSNQIAKVLNLVEKKFGHRDLYCYGVDEAGPDTVRREMPFFMICKLLGAHPFISMSHAQWTSFATDGNNVPARIGRTNARNWHEAGAIVTTYAAPFSGPENPEPWRRKGIRLYQANFDGCNEYNWYEGGHIWNDFAFQSRYKPFNMVYPTADGVIDTIAWEALRESFDDVRYLTLCGAWHVSHCVPASATSAVSARPPSPGPSLSTPMPSTSPTCAPMPPAGFLTCNADWRRPRSPFHPRSMNRRRQR